MIYNNDIRKKLTEIAKIVLEEDYENNLSHGLNSGISGIALFCFLYYKEYGIQTYWDKGWSLLNQCIEKASNSSVIFMVKIAYVNLIISLISINTVYTQDLNRKYAGIYREYPMGYTELLLVEDGTFTLSTYGLHNHQGQWIVNGNEIILNPEKNKRYPRISVFEQVCNTSDSIEIKFHYQIETYEDETFIECTDYDFDLLAVYFNNPKHFVNVVRQQLRTTCMFSPRIRNQIIVHPEMNVIKIKQPKRRITKIGIYAPNFDQPVELDIINPQSNRFEIFIIHPIDREGIPRSKSVVIKGMRAYFFERNGKVDTGFFANPLWKMKPEKRI